MLFFYYLVFVIGGVGRMEVEQIVLSACITIFSLGLLVVSLASYQKYKNVKLLVVSIVFLVFFVKGFLMSLRVFFSELSWVDGIVSGSYNGVFDLFVLVLLFIATLKR